MNDTCPQMNVVEIIILCIILLNLLSYNVLRILVAHRWLGSGFENIFENSQLLSYSHLTVHGAAAVRTFFGSKIHQVHNTSYLAGWYRDLIFEVKVAPIL